MAKIDKEYHKLLKEILNKGFTYDDPNRNGVKRIQIPSYTFNYDFKYGFPAITTKKLYWKGVVGELLWFLRGDTNIKYLVDNNINIWNKDAYNFRMNGNNNPNSYYQNACNIHSIEDYLKACVKFPEGKIGDLGRVYGTQWRSWKINEHGDGGSYYLEKLDQISNLIKGLKENPMGTIHIVTAWNPAELDAMALPPCHWSFEVLVEPLSLKERVKIHDKLHIPHNKAECDNFRLNLVNGSRIPKYQFTLKWHQRSVDTFLGLPFNIASYALLAQIIGKLTNMIPKGIVGDLSNVHIYEPHLSAVKEQLSRDVNEYSKCELDIGNKCLVDYNLKNNNLTLDDLLNILKIEYFKLKEYKSFSPIKAEMLPYNK